MIGLPQQPLKGHKVAPRSIAKIREAAAVARSVLCPDGDAIDFPMLLERLVVFGITLHIVEDNFVSEMGLVEASLDPSSMTLYLPERIYTKLLRGDGRAKFTVAHELGHLVLSHQAILHRGGVPAHKIYEDAEWQADTFAAEFIMPLEVIQRRGLHAPWQLQDAFGVSTQAAEVRLSKLRKDRLLK